ncbi:MAG: hypothetical protein KAJ40_02440 [Alphaproteobacteria bacterium]|nr:hypothetical protein [Alphaproteobacteria bacterium]
MSDNDKNTEKAKNAEEAFRDSSARRVVNADTYTLSILSVAGVMGLIGTTGDFTATFAAMNTVFIGAIFVGRHLDKRFEREWKEEWEQGCDKKSGPDNKKTPLHNAPVNG